MIPLCLITGFLGSGKTTLLRHIAEQHPGRNLVFLVNEFSSADIDAQTLQTSAKDVLCIPGGSIFCTCLVSEFIRVLSSLPAQFPEMEGVVIEASGIANPKVVEQMLQESKLDATYTLVSIIGLADPGTLPILLQTLPNIRAQIESSDIVLLNKTDLFCEKEIEHSEHEIRAIKPDIPILRTQFCTTPLDPFALQPPRGLSGEYALCRDPNYASFAIPVKHPIDAEKLLQALAHLPSLYRAKGFIPGEHGPYFVDVTCANASTHETPDHAGPCELALIVHRSAERDAHQLIAKLISRRF